MTANHGTQPPPVEVLPPLPSQPARAARWPSKLLAAAGVLISILYLANIGAGIFDLIPDLFPGVGNLDEVLFTGLLIYCLRQLGIDLLPLMNRAKQ